MTSLLKTRNIYKLITFIFLTIAIVKIRTQLITLKTYDSEIAILNEKITVLQNQENNTNAANSRKDNEDIARKNLKMYYPNETPYKGY